MMDVAVLAQGSLGSVTCVQRSMLESMGNQLDPPSSPTETK